jgi:hypothetical protein
MQAWQFSAMQALSRNEKVHGVALAELKESGYIFLEQNSETWLPTPEALEEFKAMARELETGKVQYPAG